MHPKVHCSPTYNRKTQTQENVHWQIKAKEDAVYVHSEMLAIKNNEIMPFVATRMDLEIITLSEVSQKEKGKYYMKPLAYGT